MAHRNSVAPSSEGRGAKPTGLWIVDAETTKAFQVQVGTKPFVIPPGRTVESLMDAVSGSLDEAVARLTQIRGSGRSNAGSTHGDLDAVVALLQRTRAMNGAAYETLLETAITIGQQ